MDQYLNLLKHVLENGTNKSDRTGTGTKSCFGYQMRFDLSDGFPLVTTKKIHLKSVIHELLWFLKGDTHVKYLKENKVKIWNEWATKEQCLKFNRLEGDLGPIYGHQWRNFGATEIEAYCDICLGIKNDCWACAGEKVILSRYRKDGIDQIQRAVDLIKNDPNSRRIIVTGWNPKESDKVSLPPCHTLFQFYVNEDKLSCQLYQRSADVFLGVPFNIASYSLLLLMMAQVTGKTPGEFVHTFGDVHLYNNHVSQAREQLSRDPYPLPTMELNPKVTNIFDFKYEDFKLVNYQSHPKIKAPIAI